MHCADVLAVQIRMDKDCNIPKMKKVTRQHPLQVKIPKSKRFAEDRGEIVSEAIWSHFETVLLNELRTVLLDQPTNEVITKMY